VSETWLQASEKPLHEQQCQHQAISRSYSTHVRSYATIHTSKVILGFMHRRRLHRGSGKMPLGASTCFPGRPILIIRSWRLRFYGQLPGVERKCRTRKWRKNQANQRMENIRTSSLWQWRIQENRQKINVHKVQPKYTKSYHDSLKKLTYTILTTREK